MLCQSTRRFLLLAATLIASTALVATSTYAQPGVGGGQGGAGGGGFGVGGGGGVGGQGGGGAAAVGAGVVVDAEGVLRLNQAADPTGQLTRQRQAAAKAALDPNIVRASELRHVSLNRLEAALAERIAAGKPFPEEMKYLAGLTRLKYVFFIPETNDIVIAGPAEGYMLDVAGRPIGVNTGRSVLELQDLIVAIRAFPPAGKRVNVIGVSIDPTPEGLRRMQQFLIDIAGRVRPNDANRIADGLRQSLGRQIVTVSGVSPKTHFSQVLVEADYRMKLIGIGLEVPPVKINSYVARANSRDISKNAMQRWYFVPDYECVRVAEDELAMELVGDGVKLVNADELVQAGGQRVAGGKADLASQAFCKEFTAKYGELAKRVPVYAQMRNLIDMSIAAAFMQQRDYYNRAGWKVAVFGNEQACSVEFLAAPNQVDTAVNVVWKGNTLVTPIGGGVHIQPRMALESQYLLRDEKGELSSLRSHVNVKALPKGQWWWD